MRITRPVQEPIAIAVGAVVVVYALRTGESALYVLDAARHVLVARHRASQDLRAVVHSWCRQGIATPLDGGHETRPPRARPVGTVASW